MGYKLDKDPEAWGEMVIHVKRFFRCITHPFSINIYREKLDRKGYEDFHHAFTNLFVEFCRASPYHAGHIWMFSFLAMLLAIILLAIF